MPETIRGNPLDTSYEDSRGMTGHDKMELQRLLLEDPKVRKLIRCFFNYKKVHWILICGSSENVATFAYTEQDIPSAGEIQAFADNLGRAPFPFYRTEPALREILKES